MLLLSNKVSFVVEYPGSEKKLYFDVTLQKQKSTRRSHSFLKLRELRRPRMRTFRKSSNF